MYLLYNFSMSLYSLSMKKYIFVPLSVIFIIPLIASASWWNPFSWKMFESKKQTSIVEESKVEIKQDNDSSEEIKKLKQQVFELQKQKNSHSTKTSKSLELPNDLDLVKKENQQKIELELKAKIEQEALLKQKQEEQARIGLSKKNVPDRQYNNGVLDLSGYRDLLVSEYLKNPKASINKPVKIIKAKILGFNQGSENYIQVMAISGDISYEKINFRVSNDNDYTSITNQLSKWDHVVMYGYGDTQVKFNVVGNGGSYDIDEPVINLDAIYKCDQCNYSYELGAKEIFRRSLNH